MAFYWICTVFYIVAICERREIILTESTALLEERCEYYGIEQEYYFIKI